MTRGKIIAAALFASAMTLGAAAGALAQGMSSETQRTPSAAQTAQQERMKTCNADAGSRNLAGDARKGFMSDCLAGKSASGANATTGTPATSSRPGTVPSTTR